MTEHNLELMEKNRWYVSGISKGRREGIQIGKQEALQDFVKKLANSGMTKEQIANIIELDADEVK